MKRKRFAISTPNSDAPDFHQLSLHHPSLSKHLITANNRVTLNFTDPVAVYSLNQAILSDEYDINILDYEDASKKMMEFLSSSECDSHPSPRYCRLIPPIKNRMNYINWLEELFRLSLHSNNNNSVSTIELARPHVIDIGVGASCIYPFLGHSTYGWKFTGTDIDEMSLHIAHLNLSLNKKVTAEDIALVKTTDCTALQRLLLEDVLSYKPAISHELTEELSQGSLLPNSDHCDDFKMNTLRTDSIRIPHGLIKRTLAEEFSKSEQSLTGPVMKALISMGGLFEEHAMNRLKSFLSSSSEIDVNRDLTFWGIDACMTNPPFYDINEEVCHRSILSIVYFYRNGWFSIISHGD